MVRRCRGLSLRGHASRLKWNCASPLAPLAKSARATTYLGTLSLTLTLLYPGSRQSSMLGLRMARALEFCNTALKSHCPKCTFPHYCQMCQPIHDLQRLQELEQVRHSMSQIQPTKCYLIIRIVAEA